ncbi:hypothetical protein QJS10_CPA05g01937 [Acorus calamus]|uniref:Uncharacterized protein n=1 Tax=Acorus calamus TaxID=4465 RepID=A0AAV9EXD0_ACOCL|nr:hypothetical protein QJS10_CPA05g01937 [Acorus calamus]
MFDRPVPLLRGPIRAGPSDDPSMGPFVLAFRGPESWRSAFLATESKIIEQCEAGARMGCSISASKKCKPPWWKMLFGTNPGDIDERKRCEEREMSSCLEASKESCKKFAHEKCLPAFPRCKDRIHQAGGSFEIPIYQLPDRSKIICRQPQA